jgi:hypothetical protein
MPMTALPRRQRADQAPQDDGGVVAVGEAVHHARRALRAPVARVGAEAGERDGAAEPQLLGRRLHEQAHLPVASVIAEGERRAVGRRMPPCVLRMSTSGRRSASAVHPMPTFWVSPKMSPLGRCSRSSAVIGSCPGGPGAAVRTSKSDGSSESKEGWGTGGLYRGTSTLNAEWECCAPRRQCRMPNAQCSRPCHRGPKPKPEARSLEPGAWSLAPGPVSPEPELFASPSAGVYTDIPQAIGSRPKWLRPNAVASVPLTGTHVGA